MTSKADMYAAIEAAYLDAIRMLAESDAASHQELELVRKTLRDYRDEAISEVVSRAHEGSKVPSFVLRNAEMDDEGGRQVG
jgi:Na+/phosphate symporter